MPAMSESTSSGSDSEFVRMRAFAVGSLDRSQTLPRAFGETELATNEFLPIRPAQLASAMPGRLPSALTPQSARLAYLMLAELGA